MKEVKRHLIIIYFKISTETYLIKDMLKKQVNCPFCTKHLCSFRLDTMFCTIAIDHWISTDINFFIPEEAHGSVYSLHKPLGRYLLVLPGKWSASWGSVAGLQAFVLRRIFPQGTVGNEASLMTVSGPS